MQGEGDDQPDAHHPEDDARRHDRHQLAFIAGGDDGHSLGGIARGERLAGLADVTLLTASDEGAFRLGAMTSRLAQCLVLDFLVVRLAMRDMDGSGESIVKTHSMINDKL